MNILWTVNLIPRPAAAALSLPGGVLGGWVESMAAQLKQLEEVRLFVACKSDTGLDFNVETDGVSYRSIPYAKGTNVETLRAVCDRLIDETKPDIIHIEGTEFLHAAAMMQSAKAKGVPAVVSMQGILNGQYGYQCGLLPIDDMMLITRPTSDIGYRSPYPTVVNVQAAQ